MVRSIMEQDLVLWEKMPMAFAFLKWLGIPQELVYAEQIMVGLRPA
jgi:hypothetical protein